MKLDLLLQKTILELLILARPITTVRTIKKTDLLVDL